MQYICQIKDGWMLAQGENELIAVKTGYPYPDTFKSNAEMMRVTVQSVLDVHHSIDWYKARLSKFTSFAMDRINAENYIFHIRDIYNALSGNELINKTDNIEENSIYQLPDLTDDYMTFYICKVDKFLEFAECINYFYKHMDYIIDNNLSCLVFINRHSLSNENYRKLEEFKQSYIGVSTEIQDKVSEILLKLIDMDYSCLSFVLDSATSDLRLKAILEDPFVLDDEGGVVFKNYITDYFMYGNLRDYFDYFALRYLTYYCESEAVTEALQTYFNLYGEYDMFTSMLNTGRGVFCKLLYHIVKLNKDDNIIVDFDTLDEDLIARVKGEVTNAFYYYWHEAPRRYDKEKRQWIISTYKEIKKSEWGILIDKFSIIKSSINLEISNIKPDVITPEVVIWDFTKHFDDMLSRVAIYFTKGFNSVNLKYTQTEVLATGDNFVRLLQFLYSKGDLAKDSVFNAEYIDKFRTILYNGLLHIFNSGGYCIDLPKEITEVFGECNDFGKLLYSSSNYADGCMLGSTDYGVDIRESEDGSAVAYIKYVFAIHDGRFNKVKTNILKENFSYISGALLFNFLRTLCIDYHHIIKTYNCTSDLIRFDRLSIDFDDNKQLVSISYKL